ncbi:MAG: ornithine carbamoyltransferase [Myxococcota bacterium]
MSAPSDPKDFISIADWSREGLERILARAAALKIAREKDTPTPTLAGRSVLLYFEKPSLRTQVTFEVGVAELGAKSIYLHPDQVRIGVREAVEDVARNVSRWCHAMVARTFRHDLLLRLAEFASIPLLNALTDDLHPCQAMADAQTIQEHGDLRRDRLVYLGDGNNVAHSLIHLAGRLGMPLTVCAPPGYQPDPEVVARGRALARQSGGDIRLESAPHAAVRDARFVYTDVWASMGQEDEAVLRRGVFPPYQVNRELLRHAPADVRILHCLPAHRGEEITAEVFESEQSLVFEQAENRLHAQKAILEAVIQARFGGAPHP